MTRPTLSLLSLLLLPFAVMAQIPEIRGARMSRHELKTGRDKMKGKGKKSDSKPGSFSGGKKGGAGGKKGRRECPMSDVGALALGNKFWVDLWADIALGTECDLERVEEVYRANFDEDIVVTLFGGPLLDGIDAVIAAFIGTPETPGVVIDLCKNNVLSFFAVEADGVDDGDDEFVWKGNELVSPAVSPDGLPSGREYTFDISNCRRPKITAINVVAPFVVPPFVPP